MHIVKKIIDYINAIFRTAIFEGDFGDFKDQEDFWNSVMVIVCTICAALASGLTIGLMSFDKTKLEIKTLIGDQTEVAAANSIIPLIKRHHLLLVTLMLFNAAATEALPVFLGSLVPNWIAILISVSLVLIFGEIVPSSIFTGPKQLIVAAKCTGLVRFLMIFFYPIAFPISVALDYCFGAEEESANISRDELEALIMLQNKSSDGDDNDHSHQISKSYSVEHKEDTTETVEGVVEDIPEDDDDTTDHSNHNSGKEGLTEKEAGLMIGVLKLADTSIGDVMIPMNYIYSLSADMVLDEKSMANILVKGYSRIPVYNRRDKQHILGYLLVKVLIVVNPSHKRVLRSLPLRQPQIVSPEIKLLDLLRIFQSTRCHLALVSNQPGLAADFVRRGMKPPGEARFIGMVTLEDVIERLIQGDILDETDGDPSDPISTNSSSSTLESFLSPERMSLSRVPSIANRIHSLRQPKSSPQLLELDIEKAPLTLRKHPMVGTMTGTIRLSRPNYEYSINTNWDDVLRRSDRHDSLRNRKIPDRVRSSGGAFFHQEADDAIQSNRPKSMGFELTQKRSRSAGYIDSVRYGKVPFESSSLLLASRSSVRYGVTRQII